ncbi:magnesium transporter CorA family protein [Pokkaliibacter plantistimulans]|uniref:magnesium transporter CorA family protein n=1 Tax=Pokkaliibacter plantistimulans TaxID=1635171 RepID=UPI000D745E97|nr:magnesium transporter CorA family protein [Pokkaliibacter plantistimulans]
MLRICHAVPGQEKVFTENVLPDHWPPARDEQIWIDMGAIDNEQERQILLALGIEPLMVEDIQHPRKPPKLEYHDDYTFILLRGMDQESTSQNLKTLQISFLIGDNFLITRHQGRSRSVEESWQEVMAAQSPLQAADTARRIMQRIQDRYVPMLMDLENRLGEVEEELVENANDELLSELVGYKTRLRRLRRTFNYHERLFSQWKEDVEEELGEPDRAMTRLYEAAERLQSLVSLYYDWVGDLSDGYISLASHRLNNIMKVLTVITAIFVPLSFLAGLYGMNFDNIPELHFRYGYFVLLLVMTGIAAALLWLFRKSRWI